MTVQLLPATPDRWSQLGRVWGPREKDPDSCWCQRFRWHDEPDNRTALEREVREADPPVGLLAYLDQEVVGWTRVVPRSTLPGITGNRALGRLLEPDPGAWWVSCFVVRREHRGSGVGTALLEGAVDWAARQGATVLDGHPVDTDGPAGPASPSAIFTGTLAMFRRAGFVEIGRTYRTRPVMRHHLHRGDRPQSG
jgi:GNAT superfamily N-acetyltransferase